MSTELSVDVEDFDTYSIPSTSSYEGPLITFALKEFKAIINLAETVAAPLDAAFERGGVPILIAVEGDEFNADFVIATTDFDSGDNGGSEAGASAAQSRVKRESMPPPPARRSTSAATTAGGATGSNKGKGKEREVPLFNPASQDQHGAAEEEEDEYGDDGGEFDEQAFAQIDFISQQVISASQAPTTAAGSKRGRGTTLVPDTAEEEEEVKPTQLGPTQGGEGEDGGMDVDEQGGGAMKKVSEDLSRETDSSSELTLFLPFRRQSGTCLTRRTRSARNATRNVVATSLSSTCRPFQCVRPRISIRAKRSIARHGFVRHICSWLQLSPLSSKGTTLSQEIILQLDGEGPPTRSTQSPTSLSEPPTQSVPWWRTSRLLVHCSSSPLLFSTLSY